MADTGIKAPTTTPTPDILNEWTNPTYAYASDDTYATCVDNNASYKRQGYGTFGFGVPAGATIDGIVVTVEGKVSLGIASLGVWIYDGVLPRYKQAPFTITDTVYTLGSAVDLWGGTWSAARFSDANFWMRIGTIGDDDSDTLSVDAITVRVYYTEAPPATTQGKASLNAAKLMAAGVV